MRPGIVGVDGPDQLAERLLDLGVARPVLVRHPWKVLADEAPLGEHVGVVAGDRGEGVLDRQPELLDEAAVGRVEGADHLAAELHEAPVGHLRLHDPPTGPVAGLEHDHIGAPRLQIEGRRQPGQPRPHNHHVMPRHRAPLSPAEPARAPARSELLLLGDDGAGRRLEGSSRLGG